MGLIPANQRKQLLASLRELDGACPFDHTNPEDCPLHELRKMGAAKRARWFSGLSDEDVAYLTAYHHVCLGTKFHTKRRKSTRRQSAR